MSEDIIYCVSCKKEENDPKKVIECAQCHKCEHFKCRNIYGSAIRKLKAKDFFCSLECQDFFQRASQSSSTDPEVLKELRMVLTEVKGTRSEVQDMRNTISEMEKFQNFLADKLDTLLTDVKSLKQDQATLRSDAEQLKKKHHQLCNTVNELELEVDRLNRMSLTRNMIMLGIPMKKDEDVSQIVEQVSAAVGYELPEEAILEAKRLSSIEAKQRNADTAPIKVVFAKEQYKEELIAKKRSFGPLLSKAVDHSLADGTRKIVLRDELTPRGMELYKQVRDLQDSLNFKFVWPGRNGVVLAKRNEHSKIELIRSQSDILGLQRTGTKRNLDNSMNSSMQSSPIPEPSAKRR